MKEQKIVGTVIVVLILIFLAGGVWWFTQSAPSSSFSPSATLRPGSSEPMVSHEIPTSAPPPPPANSVPTPVRSMEPPAPASSTPAVASAPSGTPLTPLQTTIQEMARLIKAGDIEAVEKTYRPPDKVAQLKSQDLAALDQLSQGAGMTETFNLLAQELDSIKDMTPTFGSGGDKATYLAPKPANVQGNTDQRPITFIKVNGQWYLDTTGSPDFWVLFKTF